MPAPKKKPARAQEGPSLTDETAVVCDVPVAKGTYIISADEDVVAKVNRCNVWFVPVGVQSVESDQIKLLANDVTLDAALTEIAGQVKLDLADVPTTAPVKKAASKKAVTAKKAAVKKTAPSTGPTKKAAPAKRAAKKATTRR